ncbi:hypothetical protein BD414DRAFT_482160 [Trametes punicea]|nr:hypothetical protein BD414DRAFT_482160 [Trametes punicea]
MYNGLLLRTLIPPHVAALQQVLVIGIALHTLILCSARSHASVISVLVPHPRHHALREVPLAYQIVRVVICMRFAIRSRPNVAQSCGAQQLADNFNSS